MDVGRAPSLALSLCPTDLSAGAPRTAEAESAPRPRSRRGPRPTPEREDQGVIIANVADWPDHSWSPPGTTTSSTPPPPRVATPRCAGPPPAPRTSVAHGRGRMAPDLLSRVAAPLLPEHCERFPYEEPHFVARASCRGCEPARLLVAVEVPALAIGVSLAWLSCCPLRTGRDRDRRRRRVGPRLHLPTGGSAFKPSGGSSVPWASK